MKNVFKILTLCLIGGLIYIAIEQLWRGSTHLSMFFVGGLCFVLMGQINEWSTFGMRLSIQGLIATGFILTVEFISGLILNLWLGLGIWDYSALPFNLLGQIQLYFAFIWYGLSIGGIVLDDYLRYWLFGGEKPHYRVF